jgi:hypothetical protein
VEIVKIWHHKKFQAGFVAAIVILLGQLFSAYAESGNIILALAKINWLEVSAPVMAAIAAQGIADVGKERAKVENNRVWSSMQPQSSVSYDIGPEMDAQADEG